MIAITQDQKYFLVKKCSVENLVFFVMKTNYKYIWIVMQFTNIFKRSVSFIPSWVIRHRH